MTIAELILFSLLRLVDPSASERQRLETFAAEVTRAVDDADALPFVGAAAREATIAALLVIARHESGIRADVIDCRTRGDRGRSVSAFQLMAPWALGRFTTAEVCASNELAASQAIRVLVIHATRCKHSPPRALFRGYAGGSCGAISKAADEMCSSWAQAAAKAGVVGASCGVRRPLKIHPPTGS